jgi:hypothetical protein
MEKSVPPKRNLIGKKFERLTVVAEAGRSKAGKVLWLCVCECGGEATTTTGALNSGNTLSCGCLQRERTSEAATTHGQSRTRLYRVWKGMIKRCYKQSESNYPRYGGRGIAVCREWRESFEAFERDMGASYAPGLSIERRDNDGPYASWNCRWATDDEQRRNTRRNVWLEFRGVRMVAADWADALGMPRLRLKARLDRGWSVGRALTEGVDRARLDAVVAGCAAGTDSG